LLNYAHDPAAYDEKLSNSLKFDEYKYAIAGVPFARKWDLRIRRNLARETALKQSLNITRPYVCVHRHASDLSFNFNPPPGAEDRFQTIHISPLTDSPFDWITTLEQAAKVVLIDSCFSNLVEQLNLPVEKFFVFRSPVQYTPVLKNGWTFLR
jgi:hypothetical protein